MERYGNEKTSLLINDNEDGFYQEKEYTVNQCMEALGFGWFQIKLTFLVGFSWMSDAIAITLLAVLGPALQCFWDLSSEKTALISTCVFVGMFFGCWFWGWLCDTHGRKKAILASMVCIAFFGICSALSPSYVYLLAALVFQGFGVGGVGQSMTIYSEFLTANTRAAGLVFINLFYVLGNVLSAVMALFTINKYGWRIFILCSIVPVFIFIFVGWWLPESPRYLVAAGKQEEAEHILDRVAKDNNRKKPQGRLKIIECRLRKPRGRVSDLLNPENRRTTIILWLLWYTSVFSYYGIILCTTILLNHKGDSCGSGRIDLNNVPAAFRPNMTHHVVVHKNCHAMSLNDYLGYLLTALGEIPGLILTYLLAEKLGRKPCMALLFILSVVTISFLHMCMKKVALVTIIFLLRAFMTGLVQSVYLYTPEVYATNIRAVGLGTASAMARLGAIITPFVSQVLLETSPHMAIFLYTGLMFFCIGGSFMLPKETKGMQLQDDDDD